MNIKPKIGIDQIKFGMYPKDIEKSFGKPDKYFQDDEQNQIYIYNNQKLTLTFYNDEDLKLGYITISNPKAILLDLNPIGEIPTEFLKNITQIKSWEHEDFDTFEHHFNEDNWLILVSEFNQISKVELGVCIDKEEFLWPK